MSVPYERYENEIEVADGENSSDSEDETRQGETTYPRSMPYLNRKQRYQAIFEGRWPRQIGVLQMVIGFLLAAVGAVQVLLLPGIEDTTGKGYIVELGPANSYGLGIWTGSLLLMTGAVGFRAFHYKSITAVYLYFSLVLIDVPLFTTATVYGAISFFGNLKRGTVEFSLQVSLLVLVLFSLLIVVFGFLKYYEDVFCGELQLAKKCVYCCMPCFCPKAVSQDDLMNDEGTTRLPSLPV